MLNTNIEMKKVEHVLEFFIENELVNKVDEGMFKSIMVVNKMQQNHDFESYIRDEEKLIIWAQDFALDWWNSELVDLLELAVHCADYFNYN